MFTTFGLMNVIIGVVVDNVINQAQECDEEHRGQFRLQNLEVLSEVKDLYPEACKATDTGMQLR